MLNKRRKNFEQPGASFSMQRQSRMKQMQKEDSKMFDNPFFWPLMGVGAVVLGVGAAVLRSRKKGHTAPALKAAPAERSTRREELVQAVLETHRQLLQMNQLRLYGKLFQDLALPLQRLLGIAALDSQAAPEWAAPEQLQEIVRDDITDEIRGVLRRGGTQQAGGRTVFPDQPAAEVPEDFIRRARGADAGQLQQSLARDRAALDDAQVWAVQRRIVEGLDWLLEELSELSAGEQYDPAGVARTARRVQEVLEQQGVFPMFCQDGRLAEYPELRECFGRVSEKQLEYPGLFFQEDGQWKRFGTLSGTKKGA